MLKRCAGQLRLGGMGGVAGVDMNAALAIANRLHYDETALVHLLPDGEAGLVTALNKREGEDDDGGT